MSIMVSKFTTKVRRAQRFVRSFLRCHIQRMDILGEMWDEAEKKYAKKLEGKMKEARKMRALVLNRDSEIDPKVVKEYNKMCDLWSAKNDQMERLLQNERDKKHLTNNLMATMHLQSIGKADKRRALSRLLKMKRNEHNKNIEVMYEKLLAERKKRALSKYGTSDVTKILGLESIDTKVSRIEEENRDTKRGAAKNR